MIDLPVGVIEPFQWNDERIPISGAGSPETQSIDDHITTAMRKYGVVGCGVSVVYNTGIIYAKGFGYSELPQTPFLATTATRCGSLAKPVTALCALLLFDQGKVDLDSKILPILKQAGIVPKPVGSAQPDPGISEITVRHLMDHTSGLPRSATYTAWREDRNVAALHELDHVATGANVVSDAMGNVPLISKPGSKYQYANANFVILACIIEAVSNMKLADYLTNVAMPRFGVNPDEIFVSRNQVAPESPLRGKTEAAYYQTSSERYVSFVPNELSSGQTCGEAYRGYATEASDGAGGIACSALGLAMILANLRSATPPLSQVAMEQIATPPAQYGSEPPVDFYSKGFNVRLNERRFWLSHGGMTNHCGGIIGHNAGYQFVAVSNWNNAQSPYVDSIMNKALSDAVSALG